MDPVWEEAARAPAAVAPAFTRMTGFFAVTSRAVRRKRTPSSMLSTYPRMTRVSGSSDRYSIRSSSDMSALFPRITTFENPIPLPIAKSRMAVQRAPDCEKKAIDPGIGVPAEKEAFSLACVLMIPRQFGPTARTEAVESASRSARSRFAPDLLEPGGDHDRSLHPLLRHERNRLDDRGGGNHEHPEIHAAGDRSDVPVEGSPEDLPPRPDCAKPPARQRISGRTVPWEPPYRLFNHRQGPPGHFCSGTVTRMCSSRSCFGSTGEGASVLRQEPFWVFGKAITSRSDFAPARAIASRSSPKASPPWGGAPNSSP